jgi:hypothetical protein
MAIRGFETVVNVESGNFFPLHVNQKCTRCNNHINSEEGDVYNCFANIRTCEDFGGETALINWNILCHVCSKQLADFLGANLHHKGRIVYNGAKK